MLVNLSIARNLRADGQTVMMELEGRGMKAQMRTANKVKAKKTYILGEDELERGVVSCKDMETSEQTEISLNELTSSSCNE